MTDFVAPKPENGNSWDVIVVGSGPAALTAAIYTTRGAASTLILAGENWGGQLMLTTQVDNFPGFPKGIMGPELMNNMRSQAERFGAEFLLENVTSVDFSGKPLKLKTATQEYTGRSVIVATGAQFKWLGVPGEEKLRGRGVSSCAPCDAPFFKDKVVLVVGGGDSAMEEALVLSKYAKEVTIVHRRSEFRASALMKKKVLTHPKIKVLWNTEVLEVLGENKLEKVKIKTNGSHESTINADGIFVAIGHAPSTSVFQSELNLSEKGLIEKLEDNNFHTKTNIDGVFTAGDVHDQYYKQAITAAGFGAMAALDALKFLDLEK